MSLSYTVLLPYQSQVTFYTPGPGTIKPENLLKSENILK